MNFITEKINSDVSVNIDDSIRLGKDQMKNFKKSLPVGFSDTISAKMKTIADGKKGVKAEKKTVLNPEIIYACALAQWHINPDLDFKKLLVYELAPYPTSIFNEKGEMHHCNQKSKLISGIKVELSARTVDKPDAFFLNDCVVFWDV